MEPTVFERIINREIPSTIEYEDHEIIAIRDIAPIAPVHILIISKRAIPSVNVLSSEDSALVGRIFLVARDLAKKFAVDESGYRIVTNCNEDAGQTVSHLHFHLLGGSPLGLMSTPRKHSRLGFAKESVILLLCAIGLATGFNAMNIKNPISWVKKEYQSVVATPGDLDKYITDTQSNTPLDTSTEVVTKPIVPTVVTEDPKPLVVATPKPPTTPTFVAEPGVVREITYAQFKQLLTSAPYYLIDARGADKYALGHIGKASNFYGGEIQSRITELLESVPRDRVVLIYCDGGECELSHHVADVLKQFNYGPIFIFTGGWAEWEKNK
ncbi:MAG: HIT domain-containing protein [Candidatus Kapabacteria bacterium]|nr:HIT domain-containing protein [Candidatus Kapabacteria bacterium]